MVVGFDRRGVIPIFPEGSVSTFTLVVLLDRPPGDELHAPGNDVWPCISDEQVNVITCQHVIEHSQSVRLLCFDFWR